MVQPSPEAAIDRDHVMLPDRKYEVVSYQRPDLTSVGGYYILTCHLWKD
jgi:hypothetical protein